MKKPFWCCHLKPVIPRSEAMCQRFEKRCWFLFPVVKKHHLCSLITLLCVTWWRARAATLPHGAENEALGCSWTLKPLNAGQQRWLHFLCPCLHFCLSLNPTFLLWGILEKRAERGFSVLLMQPPTREQRIWDTLYLFTSHLMKNILASSSLFWQALQFIFFNSASFILFF